MSVLKHGEYVSPSCYASGSNGPAEENPNALNGVKRRFKKSARASDNPSSFGSVCAAYQDAIVLREAAGSAQMRGLGLIGVLVYLGAATFLLYKSLVEGLDMAKLGRYGLADLLFDGFLCFFLFVIARPWFIAAWRFDAFSADDQPTILDRKRRKVYRLFTPAEDVEQSIWLKRLRPVHLQAVEYDWDCITAEHRVTFITTGKTARQMHTLTLVVRDRPQPGEKHGRLLDEFHIGNSMALGPNTVDMLWEYIRRFMEEGGPGLLQGETLQSADRPRTLWESMGVVGPFGPRFVWWWRTGKPIVVLFILMLPFSLPFFTLWALCNWISHMTMRQTIWPEELTELLGAPQRITAQTQ